MSEEATLQEGASTEPVETSTGEAPAEEALETQAATTDSTTGEQATTPPAPDSDTIRAEIEAELRAEYDKRLSGLQSQKDKEIGQLRGQIAQQGQARYEEAQRVAADNPAQAWQMMEPHWQAQQQQALVEQSYGNWQSYVNDRLKAEGLDPTDAEVQSLLDGQVSQIAQQSVVNPSAAASMAMGLRDNITDLANERRTETHKQEIKAAEQRGMEAAMEKMEEMVEARVTQLAIEAGIAPDAGGGTPTAPDTRPDYTRMSRQERKLAVRKLHEQEAKQFIPQ